MIFKSADIESAARTVYGEARGEPEQGKIAVAWVIRNRAKRGGWWGNDVDTVCRFPFAFSCWNNNDPNKSKILKVGIEDESFRLCLIAVAAAFSDIAPDPTSGSTHYHVASQPFPKSWGDPKEPAVIIGNHKFYNSVK